MVLNLIGMINNQIMKDMILELLHKILKKSYQKLLKQEKMVIKLLNMKN